MEKLLTGALAAAPMAPCPNPEHWPSWVCLEHEEERAFEDGAVEVLEKEGFRGARAFVEKVGADRVWEAMDALTGARAKGERIRHPAGFIRWIVSRGGEG